MNEYYWGKTKTFAKKLEYDGGLDPECIDLCNGMNSLPGIVTSESCCGHGKHHFIIFFEVHDTMQGLFFLTRCVDGRYWKYGHLWKIELTVGDSFDNGILPICFELHSGTVVGEDAYKQARDLLENMIWHLNHENFINGYKLDLNEFDIEEIK